MSRLVRYYIDMAKKLEEEEFGNQREAIRRRQPVAISHIYAQFIGLLPGTYEWIRNTPEKINRVNQLHLSAFDINGNPLEGLVAVYRLRQTPLQTSKIK